MANKALNINNTSNPLTLDYVLAQLQRDGLISKRQHGQILSQQQDQQRQVHPLIRVAEQGWKSITTPAYPLSLEILTRWLAEKTGQEYVRLDPLKIDVQKVTGFISQAYATKLKILPIKVTATELTVATCEPFIDSWENELAQIANLRIKRAIINPKDLERYLSEFYGVSRSIMGAIDDKARESMTLVQNFEQMLEVGKVGEPDANEQHIVSIVDWLLQFAFEQRASDIHLEARRDEGRVRFRIDGKLHFVHEFPAILLNSITSRLKSLGRMDVTDRRRPQDGRIKTVTPSGKEVEMRLSTMPTTFGEKLVLRIFDPDMLIKSYQELGFTKHDTAAVEQMLSSPNGIILVTGPTGSGKTTTLYSSLNQIARPEVNICTIEDPIEMVEPQFNQMQVQPVIGVDFASGVRTLLRQDPDIVMVGEIRDKETAEIAIQAALTGHLVLSSLHTNDAPGAITRLVDIDVQPYLVSATLLGVLAQRLIRTLCPHCKQAKPVDKNAWRQFAAPLKLSHPKKTFAAKGCDECRHTGYMGRVGIYEILTINDVVRKQIVESSDLTGLRETALAQGMRPLKVCGAQKVADGVTTLEEVHTVLPD